MPKNKVVRGVVAAFFACNYQKKEGMGGRLLREYQPNLGYFTAVTDATSYIEMDKKCNPSDAESIKRPRVQLSCVTIACLTGGGYFIFLSNG